MPEQPSVEQGQWQKRKTLIADWDFWQIWDGPRPVADFLLEPDADRIIADHTIAALVPELLAALRAVNEYNYLFRNAYGEPDDVLNLVLAAIAQAEAAQQGETA